MSKSEPDSYSRAEAAQLLQVSVAIIDRWVTTGVLPSAEPIPAERLRPLAAELAELREQAKTPGLLAEVMLRLEQQDPEWQRTFQELYGPALAAREAGDELVSAAPAPDWGPND